MPAATDFALWYEPTGPWRSSGTARTALALTVRSELPRAARFQWATRVFTFLVFAITLIALRGGSVRVLGIVFVAAVVLALVVRLWARDRYDHAPAT